MTGLIAEGLTVDGKTLKGIVATAKERVEQWKQSKSKNLKASAAKQKYGGRRVVVLLVVVPTARGVWLA